VLDIGANVGLFTRQIALRLPNVERFLCVEPESNNFHALKYNVRQLGPSASLWNVALSDSDGEARFFRDSQNIGNYSLNDDAMRNRTFDTVTVRCAAADRWMHDHVRLAEEESVIRKSDSQGYDDPPGSIHVRPSMSVRNILKPKPFVTSLARTKIGDAGAGSGGGPSSAIIRRIFAK
jgi:FkbM family methyltransferase